MQQSNISSTQIKNQFGGEFKGSYSMKTYRHKLRLVVLSKKLILLVGKICLDIHLIYERKSG